MEKVQQCLVEIPKEIRNAIKAISDDTRLAIFIILLKKGELSFSQILERLGLNSSTLSHHLKILTEAGLIENYYSKKPGIDEYSFYNTTSFGTDFLTDIVQVLDVTPKIRDAVSLACAPAYPKLRENITQYLNEIRDSLVDIWKVSPYMSKSMRRESVSATFAVWTMVFDTSLFQTSHAIEPTTTDINILLKKEFPEFTSTRRGERIWK